MAHLAATVAPERLEILLNDEVLKTIARETNGRNRKIVCHYVSPLRNYDDDEVQHYSLIVSVELWNKMQNRKELKFFLKAMLSKDSLVDLPECSSVTRNVAFLSRLNANELFRDEVQYYSKIQPLLQSKYFGFPWSPRCQLSCARLIVLQDMNAMGYESCTVDRNVLASGNCFALEHSQVRAALACLANLHAASMLAEAHCNIPLNELFPYAFKEKVFKRESSMENGFRVIERMVNKFGLRSGMCSRIFEKICELIKPKNGYHNVVNHGAPYGSNLLFDSRPWCLLVDYGRVRYAPVCLDVAIFIYMHTTPLYRAETEMHLIDHYATCLQQTLQQSSALQGVKIGALPTPESIVDNYRHCRLVGMAHACYEWMIAPLLLEENGENFFDYLEACKLRLGADPDADNMAKDLLIELFEEAERLIYD